MINISFTKRLRIRSCGCHKDRDRDILIGFPTAATKALVLDLLWNRPKITIKGPQLIFPSDLCQLTIQNRREWCFLTVKLTVHGIPYKWGYPHKLLIEYKGKIVAIKTLLQARSFETELDKKEVEVTILNSPQEVSDSRRASAIYRVGKKL